MAPLRAPCAARRGTAVAARGERAAFASHLGDALAHSLDLRPRALDRATHILEQLIKPVGAGCKCWGEAWDCARAAASV